MTRDDFEHFSSRLVAVAEMYNEKLSEAKILLYFDALSDLELEDVFRSFQHALGHSVWFPRPATIREHIEGTQSDQSEQAWIAWKDAARRHGAYTSLECADAALAETILVVFGSWPNACQLSLSDEMWSSKRKEFERVYRIFLRRELRGPRRLAGIAELQNTKPEWDRFTPVAFIGDTERKMMN